MTDFMALCTHRQTCRNFSDKPVDHETLVKLMEMARLTPSACNSQPWHFYIAEKPDIVKQIAEAGQQLNANPYIANAKAFIAVAEKHAVLMPNIRKLLHSQYFANGDLGAATAYLCLGADALGLGSCMIGIFDREALCDALNISQETPIAALIALGYPADEEIRPKARKPLDEIATFIS